MVATASVKWGAPAPDPIPGLAPAPAPAPSPAWWLKNVKTFKYSPKTLYKHVLTFFIVSHILNLRVKYTKIWTYFNPKNTYFKVVPFPIERLARFH